MNDKAHEQAETETDLDVQSGFVPADLDEYARAVWRELAPALIAARRLTQTDIPAMKRYCDLTGQYWKVSQQIREEGRTYWAVTVAQKQAKDGEPQETNKMMRKHPLLPEQRALAAELRQIEDKFGMTPLARENLINRRMNSDPRDELPFGDDGQPQRQTGNGPDNWLRN